MFWTAVLAEDFEIRMTMSLEMVMEIDIECLFALNMALVHRHF